VSQRSATSLERDWHQFRLLSKDAVRQLIDTALLSRDSDPMQFVVWTLALVATPTAFFAFRQINIYAMLLAVEAPDYIVQRLALAHRLFFVTYAMLAAALLASMAWDALFPDGRDQEIVGVLPVRPHVFAASRLWAALSVGFVFAAAVNVPAAVMYSVFCLQHPVFGYNFAGLLVGHLLATTFAFMLVYCTLLTIRGFAAIFFGPGAGKWFGALLQLVSVVSLFEAFFFLPGVSRTAVARVGQNDPAMLSLPPVWFVGLHAWLVGSANQLLAQAMVLGLATAFGALAVVVPIYLLPARWLGKRALEQKSRERATGTTFVVRTMAAITRATPPMRSVFLFAVVSLLRSRRHLIVLASYLGMAFAVSIATLLSVERRGEMVLDSPIWWVLTLPLLFLFFGLAGLRSSFRIPTELESNWPFRLAQPSLATCVNASVLTMFTLAVLPIGALTFFVLVSRWALSDVLILTGLQMLAGVLLAECLLFRWTKVPFACAHAPSPDVLKAWWPLYAFAMYLYAFQLPSWQIAALSSSRALLSYVGFGLVVIAVVRFLRRRELRHKQLEFDLAHGTLARLDLSEALN
jgi:hypothetical protein